MAIQRIKEFVDAYEAGQYTYSTFRKAPSQTTTARVWFDLSMSSGNPTPQYYAASPLISVAFRQSTDGGIRHGGNVSPKGKYIKSSTVLATAATALPMPMILLDYLLYYPFVDEGTTDPQPLTNSVTLPRYTSGNGVQVMAISVAARTGGQSFFITYTNQDGVGGRTSQTVVQNSATATGTLVTSNTGVDNGTSPFIPLQAGDTGVRSIESVTMLGTDVGLFTLVLVKPLFTTQIVGIDAPVEIETFINNGGGMPKVEDDAYLNYICLPQGTLAATQIHGDLTTIFN